MTHRRRPVTGDRRGPLGGTAGTIAPSDRRAIESPSRTCDRPVFHGTVTAAVNLWEAILDFAQQFLVRPGQRADIGAVDANKTDMGPPSALTAQGKLKAMRGLADAFAAMVDETLDN